MTTKVEKSIQVGVPVDAVYAQWTQFEEFPQFMGGVSEVQQLTDTTLHWVAEIKGVRREWDATILEQVPNEKIAWAAVEGATNAGAVYFAPCGAGETLVRLVLEYAPEGIVENVGDKLGIIEKQAESDLERFKTFIESRGRATGAWEGEVPGTHIGTPGVAAAMVSEGDSGKSGFTTTAKVAGAAAAVGVAAAAGLLRSGGAETPQDTASSGAPGARDTELGIAPGDSGYIEPLPPVSQSPYTSTDEAYPVGEPSPLPQSTQSI